MTVFGVTCSGGVFGLFGLFGPLRPVKGRLVLPLPAPAWLTDENGGGPEGLPPGAGMARLRLRNRGRGVVDRFR